MRRVGKVWKVKSVDTSLANVYFCQEIGAMSYQWIGCIALLSHYLFLMFLWRITQSSSRWISSSNDSHALVSSADRVHRYISGQQYGVFGEPRALTSLPEVSDIIQVYMLSQKSTDVELERYRVGGFRI